jgi:hypothetical protein
MKFAHTPHERRTDRRRTDAYTHETASAGWREEYEYQSATAQLRADGGAERPADCICWNADAGLPCFPCFLAGFETQNPAEPGADDSDHAEETDDPATLEAFADGGTTDALPAPGDEVRDREEGDRLVVVETHADTTAAEYEIAALEDATVAEVNDRWSADAPVVEAAYVADIEDRLDGWRSVEDLRDAVAFDALRAYSFPADRLAALPGGERR